MDRIVLDECRNGGDDGGHVRCGSGYHRIDWNRCRLRSRGTVARSNPAFTLQILWEIPFLDGMRQRSALQRVGEPNRRDHGNNGNNGNDGNDGHPDRRQPDDTVVKWRIGLYHRMRRLSDCMQDLLPEGTQSYFCCL